MGKLKRELAEDLKHLSEAYDQLAQHFDEINTERLALIEAATKKTYINNTQSMYCSDGEFIAEHSNGTLIWDAQSLFEDLPFIVTQVTNEAAKTAEMHLEMLKDSLKELSI